MTTIPTGLSRKGRTTATALLKYLTQHNLADGCVFYSPDQWKARGEQYNLGALFVVTFDGSNLYDVVNCYCGFDRQEKLMDFLGKKGVYYELGYAWCFGIYES